MATDATSPKPLDSSLRSRLVRPAVLAFQIAFVVPFTVLYFNMREVSLELRYLLAQSTQVFLALLALLAILAWPSVLRARLAALYLTLSAYALLFNFFLPIDAALIDGRADPADAPFAIDGTLLLSGAVLLCLLFVSARERFRKVVYALAAVSVLWVGFVTWAKLAEEWRSGGASEAEIADFLDLSTEKNVLVFSFDGIQGNTVTALLAQEHALAREFDGFLYFKDAAAVSPHTQHSIPISMMGRILTQDAHGEDFAENNIMATLKRHGYETFTSGQRHYMQVPGASFVPTTSKVEIRDLDRSAGVESRLAARVLQNLRRISARRVIPIQILGLLDPGPGDLDVDEPDAFIATILADPHFLSKTRIGYRNLQYFLENLRRTKPNKVAIYSHFVFTHNPMVFDRHCGLHRSNSLKQNSHSAAEQTRCVLQTMRSIVRTLKEAGAYDNSVILFLSDHGSAGGLYPPPVAGANYFPNHRGASRWNVGRYVPFMMVKDFGASGPLRISSVPASLMDVAPTICAAALDEASCGGRGYEGVDLLRLKDVGRTREALLRLVPGNERTYSHFERFTIAPNVGPSIQEIYSSHLELVHIGEPIRLLAKEHHRQRLLVAGLSPARGAGWWIDSSGATVEFRLGSEACTPCTLDLRINAQVAKDASIPVFFNGQPLGTPLRFKGDPGGMRVQVGNLRYEIPPDLLAPGGINTIEFGASEGGLADHRLRLMSFAICATSKSERGSGSLCPGV